MTNKYFNITLVRWAGDYSGN